MNLSPELWYVIASVAVTLIVQAAHTRGIRLPIVESILDLITKVRPPATGPNQTIQLVKPEGSTADPEVSQSPDGSWSLQWRSRN